MLIVIALILGKWVGIYETEALYRYAKENCYAFYTNFSNQDYKLNFSLLFNISNSFNISNP
jgi:hypothetical protein